MIFLKENTLDNSKMTLEGHCTRQTERSVHPLSHHYVFHKLLCITEKENKQMHQSLRTNFTLLCSK